MSSWCERLAVLMAPVPLSVHTVNGFSNKKLPILTLRVTINAPKVKMTFAYRK
jgi:hypothetical protein